MVLDLTLESDLGLRKSAIGLGQVFRKSAVCLQNLALGSLDLFLVLICFLDILLSVWICFLRSLLLIFFGGFCYWSGSGIRYSAIGLDLVFMESALGLVLVFMKPSIGLHLGSLLLFWICFYWTLLLVRI